MKQGGIVVLILTFFLANNVNGQTVFSLQEGFYFATMPGQKHAIKTGHYDIGSGIGKYWKLDSLWQLRTMLDFFQSGQYYYPQTFSQTTNAMFFLTGSEQQSRSMVSAGLQRKFGKEKKNSIYLDFGLSWQTYTFRLEGYSSLRDSSGNLAYRTFTGKGSTWNIYSFFRMGYNYSLMSWKCCDFQVFGELGILVPFNDRTGLAWKQELKGLYGPHQTILNNWLNETKYASVQYSANFGIRILL
ncbi:MAG: hypothetical protein GC180_09670 [Bacteroidetes bacterium]|nr:hypothetical protein [Bacteroidota bacterium]